MSGPRFDDDLDYWVDNPDERCTCGWAPSPFCEVPEHRADSFGDGYPEGYRHAADCKCSDCRH